VTKDTVAFQKALDDCAVNGGEGDRAGGEILIGSVQIGSKTVLRLGPDSIIAGVRTWRIIR